LAHRLLAVARWAAGEALPRPAPIGYFGLASGVPAVLTAAAEDPALVAAVVARGTRPDTADPNLRRIVAPTLFISGQGESPGALELTSRLALPWLLERFHAGDPRKSCAAPGISAPPVRAAGPLHR
jgi:hypothetical protein